MGRGVCSKAMRRANRAGANGKIPAGTIHSTVPGKKWTRKDVLLLRQNVQSDLLNGLIETSHIKIQQSMKKASGKKAVSKKDIIKSINPKSESPPQ